MDVVAKALGGGSAADAVQALIHALGVEPRSLGAYGVTDDDVASIVQYAVGSPDLEIEALVRRLL